ncbi:MAG TPA: hypothetical protein ENG35_06155 [Desulfobacteraceae bacterium]|nr:hypothetical protein [Desulfobacteraceae bacterium]
MDKSIIDVQRRRKIQGSFAFIEHRFIREGHLLRLSKNEILLYFFFALVSDSNGISFYGVNKILRFLKLKEDEYFSALSSLEQKDYIKTQGNKVQLLSLPELRKGPPAFKIKQSRLYKTISIGELLGKGEN